MSEAAALTPNPPVARGWLRWLILPLLVAAIFAVAGNWRALSPFGAPPVDLPMPFPSPHRTWADHIRAIDQAIAQHRERGARTAEDWLSPGAEAAAWLDRAAMTGRWQDLVAAERALDQAMARAPAAAAQHPLAARFALAVHRNAAVEPALEAARADLEFTRPLNQSDAFMLRGDVALQRGDWRTADRHYAEADRLAGDVTIALRRAFIVERTGDADAAITAYAAAAASAERPSRRMLAFVAQRLAAVELGRGNWNAAARWANRAAAYLPGDWHIVALQAQMQALAGDLPGAITAMTRVATAHDRPELWDALAAWHRAAGDEAAASAALSRADAGWRAWQRAWPEAAAAHVAEHALLAGDPARALAAARQAYAARPYGETARVLAAALLAANRADEARTLLRRTAASGWHSTEADRLLVEAELLAGDAAAAEAARDAALTRNPRAFDPAAALIRFGLH